MKFIELSKHIAAGKLLPCYVAVGDDDYLAKRAIDLFAERVELPELNISVLEDSATEGAVLAAVSTLPLISAFRLVIGSTRHLPMLVDYLKSPSATTAIVLRAEKGYRATNLVEVIDCNRLTADILRSSIAAECKKNGCSITPAAAELLSEYCRRLFGRIKGELNKLIDYKSSSGEVITEADIKALVKPDVEYRVFELSDSIIKKDSYKALTLLEDMLSEGYGAAIKVFGLLYSHFHRLMAVSLDPDCGQYMDIKGYALTAAINQSKAFSRGKLKQILDKLHQLDLALKTGLTNDKDGLTAFVLETINI